jgi:hypothetical protein
MVRLYSNAGTPPKPDEELMRRIASLKEVDFEEVARIIREHRRKRKSNIGMQEVDDRLTI